MLELDGAGPIGGGGELAAPSGGPRRVLVTGGAGFVGSHVAEAHLARGDRVWILDDLSTGSMENLPRGAEFAAMDVAGPAVREFVAGGRFDIVNHHAAQIDVRFSVADPAADARVNVLGLVNVLEGARLGGTRRFVFASSGGVVYGEPTEFPTPESHAKRPASPYGVSKLAGEHYLDFYREVHGLDCVALRYANVYGPRQDPRGQAGVVSIFCQRLLDGRPLVVYGDGEQSRDYVYVEDVARANLIAAGMPSGGGAGGGMDAGGGIDAHACNVGAGTPTSVNRLAELIEEAAGTRAPRERRAARAGELRRSALATDRMRALGWAPRTGLREGLARTWAHIAAAQPTAAVK